MSILKCLCGRAEAYPLTARSQITRVKIYLVQFGQGSNCWPPWVTGEARTITLSSLATAWSERRFFTGMHDVVAGRIISGENNFAADVRKAGRVFEIQPQTSTVLVITPLLLVKRHPHWFFHVHELMFATRHTLWCNTIAAKHHPDILQSVQESITQPRQLKGKCATSAQSCKTEARLNINTTSNR